MKSINARTRTAKLCDVAKDTDSRLVTNWIEVSRSSIMNTTTLSLLANLKPKTDCDTVQSTIIPSNHVVFQETRDFVRTEKAERVQIQKNLSQTVGRCFTGA